MTEQARGVEPPWVRIARGEIGQAEHLPGGNPRIQEYRAVVGAPHGTNWCAAFAAWCLTQAGYSGPWNAAARSFLHVGKECEFKPGCIAVLWRGAPKAWEGHVAFCLGQGDGALELLGGNQGGRVWITEYPQARLLGFRWPA